MKRYLRPALVLMLSLAAVQAQTNPPAASPIPTLPGRPIPPRTAAPPLGTSGAAPVQTAPEPTDPGIQMMNMPAAQVLEHYERITGKRIIREANLADVKLTLNVKGPLPLSEAVRLLEAALLLNGFSIIPMGDNAVKVVATKNPRSEGVPLYVDAKDLPLADQVASFFMPLSHISPAEAVTIFQNQIAGHPYTAYIPVPGAQAIVITESSANIRRLIQLRDLIDVPPAKVVTDFIALERADAEIVAQTVIEIIQKKETTGTTPGAAPAPVRTPGLPGQPAAVQAAQAAQAADSGPNENALVAGEVKIIPDKRTNRILVITRPANLEFIKNLIKQFDSEVKLSSQLERPLRYVSATEVLPVLQDLITESTESATGTGGTALPGSRPTGSSGTGVRGGNQSTGSSRSSSGSGLGGGGGSGGLSRADQLDAPDQDETPVSVSVGKVRLIANPKSNSIIVMGPPDARQKVSDILDKLDQRPRQVYLSTVIGQLSLGKNSEVGIDIAQRATGNGQFNFSGLLRNTPITLSSPGDLLNGTNLTRALAGLTFIGRADDLSVYVRALQASNKFRVLSRPSVYTTNNKKAVIESGRQVPVPTSTVSEIGSGNLNNTFQSNIQFRDVVLKLEVIPLINANNEVTLQVAQINDSVVDKQSVSGNEVPVIGTQSINTTVTVPNRGIVVLGGLITDSVTENNSGVPWLQDIPLIGAAFRTRTKDKQRSELLVLIQPTVVDAPEDYAAASHEEGSRTLIQPSAVNIALPPSEFANDIPRGEVVTPAPRRGN